jgi:hypothetical protein
LIRVFEFEGDLGTLFDMVYIGKGCAGGGLVFGLPVFDLGSACVS